MPSVLHLYNTYIVHITVEYLLSSRSSLETTHLRFFIERVECCRHVQRARHIPLQSILRAQGLQLHLERSMSDKLAVALTWVKTYRVFVLTRQIVMSFSGR